VLPAERVELRQLPSEPEPVDVDLWTRYEDVGLAAPLPRETFFEVTLGADSVDAAIAGAGTVATGLATMISFCVNAFVPPPDPMLAYECSPGLERRLFWQRHMQPRIDELRPKRRIDVGPLFPFLHAAFSSSDAERIGRAVSHYQMALSYWSTRGQPLALAHLYMALEALGPVAERRQREKLGIATDKDHAQSRGVDVSKSNWKDVLLGWIRRDVLCGGDKATYDAARKASDGLEHGFMPLPEYRGAASAHTPTLLGHVRRAALSLLDLDDTVRSTLLEKSPVDTSPLWMEIRGELTGEVQDPDQLAEPGYLIPHPCVDWKITLDDAHRTEDNRLRISPRNNLTAHMADGIHMTFTHHGLAVGLSDREMFEYEPSTEDPVVIRREDQATTDTDAEAAEE
jgi:hypothetical protein